MKLTALLLTALFALGTLDAGAKERPFVDEPSSDRDDIEEGEMWKEGGVEMPPYPEESDLLEFQVDDPLARFRYFVDGENLTVGADRVVRFTLVIRSGSGSDNVSFEGIRCNTREFKTYAFGNGRGELRPLKAPVWERIKRNGPYRYHLSLRQLYFCKMDRYEPYDAKEIVRLLGETPRRVDDVDNDTGFF
jgi:hypothetical protein